MSTDTMNQTSVLRSDRRTVTQLLAALGGAVMRTCEDGCNGCDDCTDYEDDGAWCDRCNGDGRDPWNDYLLPCPACQGEQRP